MTESNESPQAGVAGALHDLSEQTRILVRHEVEAAQREMLGKAKASVPALALAALAGALGLAAAASSYRYSLRLLETRLPPAAAALTATLGYGAGAAAAAVLAARRLRELPPLFPSETARQAGSAITVAADQARS
jgi:hypothetical protein